MRIVILANAPAVHTRRWAMAYAERGHDVHVLSIRSADIPGVSVHRVGVGHPDAAAKWLTLLSYLRLTLAARWRVRALQPDVVHAHYTITHGAIAALAGLQPRVVTAWGSDVLWRRGGRGPFWFRLLNRLALRGADAVTGASGYLCRAVGAYLPTETDAYEVPFGVDIGRFHPVEDRPGRSSGPHIAFVKSLNPKYGAEHLVRAMPAVLETLPEARLVMAGHGPLEEPLRALARELGVAERVDFAGFVAHEAVPGLLRRADILVNPSVVPESFGVAPLEAAACGLPVIATHVGGVPEVVRDGVSGLLVPPGDSTALADAIVRLGRDAGLRARLGAAGREFVAARFEWHQCVDRMLGVLQGVARPERRPGEDAQRLSHVRPS